jgi:hypothetical protein
MDIKSNIERRESQGNANPRCLPFNLKKIPFCVIIAVLRYKGINGIE